MLDRRSLILAAGASAIATSVCAQPRSERLRLWPSAPPGGGGPMGTQQAEIDGAAFNISEPLLDIFIPPKPNGAAALVVGGGGYRRIGLVKEAYPAAGWLTDIGVTAFVLTYRLPNEGWADGTLVPLQDAQRAMRTMRSRAEAMGLDRQRMGVVGFSAGGHLAGTLAMRAGLRTYAPVDEIDRQLARPDFAALIYPVVTLEPPYDNTGTRRNLVGEQPKPEARTAWSLQTQLRPGCPPLFLVQTDDDPVISPENSRILDTACRHMSVPVEFHRFSKGGHGFGIGEPGTPASVWPTLCHAWLQTLDMLS
ncbi:alpha/beta hydrolase [Methylobacterium sp. WL116]|uniref:alpha/beta hydrolase n=1 Tax=Methylobacterium sp. WL116 TaxID=2603889 RepID=UPI0011C81F6F|nr:alpha/beta hydrolase [Methylobacterium sp. WL116]TXM93315.1 alpha/beta hydrolase [Methylobacterium sp. WL116]